jgi:F-type H+-transporting ATPase subunit b
VNIPLNIDWQQILLHLLNFSVLSLGLYLLLYNPVKKFMEERTEYYRRLEAEAQEKLRQAEDLEISRKERLDNIEAEIETRRVKAMQESKQAADALLQSAREEAEKLLSDAQETAQQERVKILEDAQQEIASMAIIATEKLLAQSTTGAIDQFLDAVKKE